MLETTVTAMDNKHLKEAAFSCAVCDERFVDKSSLEKHYFVHAKERIAGGKSSLRVKYCRSCGSFHHLKQCSKKYAICKICSKGFLSRARLLSHCCPGLPFKPYKCDLCENTYKSKLGLSLHKGSHHKGERHKCSVCDKKYKHLTTLRKHALTHSNVKSFVCELCNRGFTMKSTLRNHYLTHTGERPYICEVCGRRFSKSGNLKTHYRTHSKTSEPISQNVL